MIKRKKYIPHLGLILKYFIPAVASSDESLSNVENQEVGLVLGQTLLHEHRLQQVQYWLQTVELGHLAPLSQVELHGDTT